MSVHLITGYKGKEHIQSKDTRSFNAAMFGAGEFVMEIGEQIGASITNNNTVRVLDGDILMQGAHIRIETGTYEDLTVTTGTAGKKRIDLIVMTYEKDASQGTELAFLEVIKGTETEGTASVPEYTTGVLSEGALKNQMPLYKVEIEGVVLSTIEPLFKTIPTYKTLAEQYAAQFEATINALKGADILDTIEEIQANTQGNMFAGALGVKELNNSLVSINSNLNSEISRSKEADETLKSRVDNITSLPEGSTTGDAELLDIRVKADGTTATSAGNAVREQVGELKSDLNDQTSYGNRIDNSSVELGSINYLNGSVMDSNKIVRTGFTKVIPNDNLIFRVMGDNSKYGFSIIYAIFYKEDKSYDSYVRHDGFTPIKDLKFNCIVPNTAKYVRFRIESTIDLSNTDITKVLPYLSNYDEYAYTDRNPILGFINDGIRTNENHLFNDDLYNTNTETLSNAILELYVEDATYINNLRICVFGRNKNSQWNIKLYALIDDNISLIYRYDGVVNPEYNGLSYVTLVSDSDSKAYALVNWNAVEDGYFVNGLTSTTYILNKKCFDLGKNPRIMNMLYSHYDMGENSVYRNEIIDKVMAGVVDVSNLKIRRSFDVPDDKTAYYIATNPKYAKKSFSGFTDAHLKEWNAPYLYFGGKIVGAFVFYDDNGEPYVPRLNGGRYKLQYTII